MCSPSMPSPPDPRVTASAQTAQNIGTAIANNHMGNVNQVTPWGSLTYEQTGTHQFVDPNHPSNEPQAPATPPPVDPGPGPIDEPDGSGGTGAGDAGGGEADGSGAARTAGVRSPISALAQEALPTDIEQQRANAQQGIYDIPTFTATTTLPQAQQDALNAQFQTNKTLSRTARDQADFMRGYLRGGVDTSGLTEYADSPIETSDFRGTNMQRVDAIARQGADGGRIDRTGGNQNNIRMGGVNQGQIDKRIGPAGNIIDRNADGGRITRSYGANDFSQDRNKVEDALMQRMDRQFDRDRDSMRTQLANQGIAPGSEAYRNAMDDMNRGINDSRMNAILSAGQEQSRLTDMDRDRAAFQNSAQGQAYGQNAGNIDRRNAAQQQKFNQQTTRAGFKNAAQAQDFSQDMSNRQQANNAQNQRFQQSYANSQFGNQAQQQAYNQQMGNKSFHNEAQQQQFNQQRTLANDYNQNQATGFNQNLAAAQQQNAQRNQELNEAFSMRNQPINEIAALLSGSQVSNPNFGVSQPQSIPTTDYAGIQNANYQQQLQAAQMNNAGRQNVLGGLFGLGSAGIMGGLF